MSRRILSKSPVTTDVLTLAKQRIAHAFDLFDHIAVSFSGGKDSTVCLNLALDEATARSRLPLDVIFFDEEAIPHETAAYVARVAARPDVAMRWYALPVKHRNGCSRRSPWWYPFDPACPERWVRAIPAGARTALPGFQPGMTIPECAGLLFDPARYGTVGMVMGIRADESRTRQAAVSRKREENYLIPYDDLTSQGNVWKVYPIYDWRTTDVWTAPATQGWDYNRAYDLMDQAGISPHRQRCAPPFGEEPMQALWMFQVCFPTIWDRLYRRVPGAATAARYARTELYAFGGQPEKPEDMTWEDFLLHYIRKFDPVSQREIAQRIREEINGHYAKTRDPILPTTPHPLTGMCWAFLLQLASRGDFKHRRSAVKKVEGKDRAVIRRRWEEERTAMEELGRW